MCVTWLLDTCAMTHLYVWNDSFVCVKWLNCMCAMTCSYLRQDSCICVPWLIHVLSELIDTCAMACVFIFVIQLIYLCAMTHLFVCHDSFILCHNSLILVPLIMHTCDVVWSMCVPWLIYMCAMTPLYVQNDSFIWWHDSFILCHNSLILVPLIFHTCDVTHLDIAWLTDSETILWALGGHG